MAQSPLYDIFDPYGAIGYQSPEYEFDELGNIREKRRGISDLLPEQEKTGLLRSLSQVGSSGLGAAAWLLDTPGAIVRGILAGKPLSGFGSTEDRVSGRDLLRQYGMVGSEDNWGNFSGGLAAEALLDPLTYASLGLSTLFGTGARGAAGRAARLAGLTRNAAIDSVDNLNPLRAAAGLPEYADDIQTPRVREYLRRQTARGQLNTIEDRAARTAARSRLFDQYRRMGLGPEALDSPLSVLDEFRIPGFSQGLEIQGGRLGDAVAEFADRAGNWTKTAPVVGNVTRTAAALFDPTVGGISSLDRDLNLTNDIQVSARRAAAQREAADIASRRMRAQQMLDAMQAQVPDAVPAAVPGIGGQAIPESLRQFNSSDLWNSLQDYAESPSLQGPTLTGAPLGKTSGDAVTDWVLENVPEFRTIRDSFVDLGETSRQRARDAGLSDPLYQSAHGNDFFPRQMYWFERERPPNRPGAASYREKPWARDQRLFSTVDNFGRRRDPAYDIEGGARTFRALTGNSNPLIDSSALQQALIDSPDAASTRRIIDNVFRMGLGTEAPYEQAIRQLQGSAAYRNALPAEQATMLTALNRDIEGRYERLANILRSADTQFASEGVGIFDSPSWNNAVRYEQGVNRNVANADELFRQLVERADDMPAQNIPGGVNVPLAQAAEQLGFDPQNFAQRLERTLGYDPSNYSINSRTLSALRALAPQTQLATPERGVVGLLDSFTNAFKIGALASPAFHVRNAYSGAINAASLGAFNPLDFYAAFQASRGNYDALGRRLRNAPGYDTLATDAERARRFLTETGAQRVAGGTLVDDVTGRPNQSVKSLFTGGDNNLTQAPPPGRGMRGRLNDFFSMRGVGITDTAPTVNTNPLLRFNDTVGQRVEDMLRTGTFLNQVRKGVAPEVAGDITRMAQVDYAPESFTSFERKFLKRLFPFYSFQKGILPSIGENLVYRPGGLNSQLIRAVTRGAEPSEENFVPDYLRASAAIPLPSDLPGLLGGSPKEGLQRYLTNIDLPFESTLNLFTPGIGGTTTATVADTIRNTGSNILGMTNPLLKGPLEYITNRQLYTGRQLSDLYSVLEQDIGEVGRPIEQAVVNFVPFGSRGLGLYRQLRDDRLDPADRAAKAAWNLLAGVKLTDIDQDRTRQLAARNVLNKILESTPGVKTFENLSVPQDALEQMPPDQQRLYLLYKVLQSDAAARARARKKAEADPLAAFNL